MRQVKAGVGAALVAAGLWVVWETKGNTTKRKSLWAYGILALGVAAMLGVARSAVPASAQTPSVPLRKPFAKTITVTTLTDHADPPFNTDTDGGCGTGTLSDLPGADGLISLREAIIAANNTEKAQIITFDPSLSGGTIFINFDDLDADADPDPLAGLCGGNTTINGDLDGDNVPDVTVDGSALSAGAHGIHGIFIPSSNNTVNGLKVQDFPDGGIVVFHESSLPEAATSNNTIANNVLSGGVAASLFKLALKLPLARVPSATRL